METVGFKHASGDPSFTEFDAVLVIPDWDVQNTIYSDINDNLRKIVDVKHKVWKITFAAIDVSGQDFLIDMKGEEAPQMYYDSATYNIRVLESNIKHIGSMITVSKVEKTT